METKVKLVKDLITSLGLTKQEVLDVVLFLVSDKKLVLADFPQIQSKFRQIVELHGLLNKQFENLLQGEDDWLEQSSASPEKEVEVKPKRKYTKRAKTASKEEKPKRKYTKKAETASNAEKPKRKYTKQTQQSSPESLSKVEETNVAVPQKALSDSVDISSEKAAEKALAQKEPNKIKKTEILEQNRKDILPSKNDVDDLAMGKVLTCKLLYQTKEGLHLSDRALNSLNPEGVQVPYRINGKFFILRIYDEAQGLTLKEAVAYAKKLPRLNDKPWMVLTPQQKESCLAVKADLNEALKKVGGDLFDGGYLTNPPSYGKKGEKIRFAVDVEL